MKPSPSPNRTASSESESNESHEKRQQVVDEKLSLVAMRPIKQKKLGKEVTVLTNSFSIDTPLDKIHLYQTEFTPDIPEDASDHRLRVVNSKSIRENIVNTYGPYFFENKHLLCLRPVEGENQITNEDLTQTVTLKYLKAIDLKNLDKKQIEQHEQIIHIMLNKVIRGSDLIRIGPNYYERTERLFSGDSKLDISVHNCPKIRIWRGYSISCERKIGGIHMSVDSVHRILHQKSVGDKMREMADQFPNEKLYRRRVEEMLVDNVVITIHNRRLYRVTAIDWDLGVDDTFEKDGKKISYRDYFKSTYGEDCNQRFKGMLVHVPRKKRFPDSPDRFILPPMLCHETGLSKKLKSNFTLMRSIADTTRIEAKERHKIRMKLVKRMQDAIGEENNYDTDSMEGSQKGKARDSSSSPGRDAVQTNGAVTNESQIPMILGSRPVRVQGRVLPAFKINMAGPDRKTREVDPYKELQNSWNSAHFINSKPEKIRHWVIAGEEKRVIDICMRQIRNIAATANLQKKYISGNPTVVLVPTMRGGGPRARNNTANWKESLEEAINKLEPNIIVCILPDDRKGNPTAVYNLVKTLCCTQIPVLTQCITTRNVMNQKRSNSVFKGCLKQMLTKMGNTPWRASFSLPNKSVDLSRPTMICGMDVNHDMRRNVSTVAFVASYTTDYTQYNTSVYHQKFGREVMIDGGTVMGDALKRFHKCNKTLPEHIIVYRDGVSTAQLSVVVLHEVRSFRERFANIRVKKKAYNPKLTVIVTQKNVSARFNDENNNSLQPGTVIDSVVVSSKFWDFFLVPCAATNRRSSASPTRFIVAYDSAGFDQDDLSMLTNQLCNLYFNFASAVRVPAPIQCAHKIAHMFGTAIEDKKPCEKLVGLPFYL